MRQCPYQTRNLYQRLRIISVNYGAVDVDDFINDIHKTRSKAKSSFSFGTYKSWVEVIQIEWRRDIPKAEIHRQTLLR